MCRDSEVDSTKCLTYWKQIHAQAPQKVSAEHLFDFITSFGEDENRSKTPVHIPIIKND